MVTRDQDSAQPGCDRPLRMMASRAEHERMRFFVVPSGQLNYQTEVFILSWSRSLCVLALRLCVSLYRT